MRKWLRSNLLFKVLSIVIALVIWFNAKTDQFSYYTVKASINIENFPKEFILVNYLPGKVDVKIYGKIKDIIYARSLIKPIIFINGKTLIKGENIISIDKSNVNMSRYDKVEVIQIIPGYLNINIDNKISKNITVIPFIKGNPKEGYIQSGEIDVIPEEIMIEGPKQLVEKMNYLNTDIIDITGRYKSYNSFVKIIIPESTNIQPETDSVRVKIDISRLETRNIKGVVISHKSDRWDNVRIDPNTIKLTLSGSSNDIDSLINAGISAYVIVNVISPGSYLLPVFIDLPENIYKQAIEPEFVKVEVID
ncbi:hypothetical protein KAU43_03205 [candidate division WOR-3 bacterium]|nr:hypothetical protein [candidate division WOR-3 bacterium]